MFGITVMGTPNPDRLFLPDQWPTDAPPLRKDFVMPQYVREHDHRTTSRTKDNYANS